jgi:hypothetical protein
MGRTKLSSLERYAIIFVVFINVAIWFGMKEGHSNTLSAEDMAVMRKLPLAAVPSGAAQLYNAVDEATVQRAPRRKVFAAQQDSGSGEASTIGSGSASGSGSVAEPAPTTADAGSASGPGSDASPTSGPDATTTPGPDATTTPGSSDQDGPATVTSGPAPPAGARTRTISLQHVARRTISVTVARNDSHLNHSNTTFTVTLPVPVEETNRIVVICGNSTGTTQWYWYHENQTIENGGIIIPVNRTILPTDRNVSAFVEILCNANSTTPISTTFTPNTTVAPENTTTFAPNTTTFAPNTTTFAPTNTTAPTTGPPSLSLETIEIWCPNNATKHNTTQWNRTDWWEDYQSWNGTGAFVLEFETGSLNQSDILAIVHFICDNATTRTNTPNPPITITTGTSRAPTPPPTSTPRATSVPPTPAPTQNRTLLLPLFFEGRVLTRTPIFTVGTFYESVDAFNATTFARALAERLRARYVVAAQSINVTGLPQFTVNDSVAIFPTSQCSLNRNSQYVKSPISPFMCRSSSPCTGTRSCLEGVKQCVCSASATTFPLNDAYQEPNGFDYWPFGPKLELTTTAAPGAALFSNSAGEDLNLVRGADLLEAVSTAVRTGAPSGSSRRQTATSTTFVQVQFPMRLDQATAYLPKTADELIRFYDEALQRTKTILSDETFAARFNIDRNFIFVRYAYEDFRTLIFPTLPPIPIKPNYYWLLVLLVIPAVALVFGAYKLYEYVKWRRYGASLSVHAEAYEPEFDTIAATMGTGEWVDGERAKEEAAEAIAVVDDDALDEFDLAIGDDKV